MYNGSANFSNGNSFDGSNGNSALGADCPLRPVPTWKFGISPASMFAGALGGGAV